MTDYGVVLLARMAREPGRLFTAHALAEQTRIAAPTVAKLLKSLAGAGLLESRRGAQGGYHLARTPDRISAVEIIDAIEGPVALTECASEASQCSIETGCAVGHNWQRINEGIRRALESVTLESLTRPMAVPLIDFRDRQSGRDTQATR